MDTFRVSLGIYQRCFSSGGQEVSAPEGFQVHVSFWLFTSYSSHDTPVAVLFKWSRRMNPEKLLLKALWSCHSLGMFLSSLLKNFGPGSLVMTWTLRSWSVGAGKCRLIQWENSTCYFIMIIQLVQQCFHQLKPLEIFVSLNSPSRLKRTSECHF